MARKVFISVLGTGPYRECTYSADTFKCTSRYIQLATMKYIVASGDSNDQWTKDDVGLILLTEKSNREQWLRGKSQGEDNAVIYQSGLKEEFEREKLPIQVMPIQIADGKNEDEIWSIFETIYASIKEGDELYFDVTHAFRYLPMLLLVLINYAKFLKNVVVKSISYGNYMAEGNEKPIMDLTALSTLQDWTFAAGQYMDSGNVKKLVELSRTQLKPILASSSDVNARTLNTFVKQLSVVIEERTTCRGKEIITSANFKRLKLLAETLNNVVIAPLSPVIDKIKTTFDDFDENENVFNGFSAAKWCLQNGLYQQAITITLESLVTFVCIKASLNWRDEEDREVVNKAFKIKEKNLDESEWLFKSTYSSEKIEAQKQQIKMVLAIPVIDELLGTFLVCTNVRNDFNHAGMKSNSLSSEKIKSKIEERILKLNEIFASC